jgi:hypothetical protein
MDTELHLQQLEAKIDKIYASVEKTRKYFFWTMVITIGALVLPLIGLAFAVPAFLTNYVAPIQSMGGL